MPPRASHLPHNRERTALQKMSASQWCSLAQLTPLSEKVLAGMIAKGWVEKELDAHTGARFRITPAGISALKTKIPVNRYGQ